LLTSALDLTVVSWEAKHKDGTILKRGPGTYEKIDRNNLETISIIYKGTKLFEKNVGDSTFVYRLRSAKPMELGHNGKNWYGNPLPVKRLGVVIAFLTKHKIKENNIPVRIFKPNEKSGVMQLDQKYEYDHLQSQFYIILPNGKIELQTQYSNESPFDKIKLRPEELKQLNCEDNR